MYIRDDFKKIIKSTFNLIGLEFDCIGKGTDGYPIFLFNADKKKFVIEPGFKNEFYGYEVKRSTYVDGAYCSKDSKFIHFVYHNGKTIIRNSIIIELEGKAFDFDTELVLIKLDKTCKKEGILWN